MLAGSNAYRPNAALGPQRALKGLALATLPPVLMIHLKRFTYDFATMRRIKINSVFKPTSRVFIINFFAMLHPHVHICSLIIELLFATRLYIQLVSFPVNLDLSAFCVNDEVAAPAAQAAQAAQAASTAPTAAPVTSAYTLFAVLVHAGLLLYYSLLA